MPRKQVKKNGSSAHEKREACELRKLVAEKTKRAMEDAEMVRIYLDDLHGSLVQVSGKDLENELEVVRDAIDAFMEAAGLE